MNKGLSMKEELLAILILFPVMATSVTVLYLVPSYLGVKLGEALPASYGAWRVAAGAALFLLLILLEAFTYQWIHPKYRARRANPGPRDQH